VEGVSWPAPDLEHRQMAEDSRARCQQNLEARRPVPAELTGPVRRRAGSEPRGRACRKRSTGNWAIFFQSPPGPFGPQAPRAKRRRLARRAALELWARAQRRGFFTAGLFGDPAWNMLLTLYVLGTECSRVSTARLIECSAMPRRVALRWLDYLHDRGLITGSVRAPSSNPVSVSLSDKARRSLDIYFSKVARPGS
jgi:hypothetical protein